MSAFRWSCKLTGLWDFCRSCSRALCLCGNVDHVLDVRIVLFLYLGNSLWNIHQRFGKTIKHPPTEILKPPSILKCVASYSLGCSSFSVQNDACARLFSHSSAEGGKFLTLIWVVYVPAGLCDITTSLETSRGLVCNLCCGNLKCETVLPGTTTASVISASDKWQSPVSGRSNYDGRKIWVNKTLDFLFPNRSCVVVVVVVVVVVFKQDHNRLLSSIKL